MNLKKIKQVFYEITIPDEFGGNGYDNDYDWIFEWIENNILPLLDGEYILANGASKVVLIPKIGKYVIKIPFNGNYTSIYDKTNNIIEEIWEDFMRAPKDCGWDYCATETEVYNKAKDEGIECFFAKTEYLCSTKNFYPIYIQEKVNTRSSKLAKNIEFPTKFLKEYEEHYQYRKGVLHDSGWMSLCMQQYGIEKTNNFINFIKEEMPFINYDMHMENYGYRENKTPCLIDFSDWCEE